MNNADRLAIYLHAVADQVVRGQHDADAYAVRFAKGRALQVRPFPWVSCSPTAVAPPLAQQSVGGEGGSVVRLELRKRVR